MEQHESIEKIEIDKEDTILVIQQLERFRTKLCEINDYIIGYPARAKLNNFIKEVNTEISFNEQILEELNDSIEFIETREGLK
jgi:hypothetical protein